MPHKVGLFLIMQRTLTIGGRISVLVVSSLTGLDLTKHENMLLFVCTETTEPKPVKLKTSPTFLDTQFVHCFYLIFDSFPKD